ncbi:MAG: mechanosensitive ion channel family protein [Halobacteriovoraceae bacterium]|nr:mechanosensitive ion channel family protein [Halobacteriovoraceae bacterium]
MLIKLRLFTLLFYFVISTSIKADNQELYPSKDFTSPRMTFNYFLKAMVGYKNGDSTAINMAIQTLDLSDFDETSKTITGKNIAISLINTLDRLEKIDINQIPKQLNNNIWYYKKKTIEYEGQIYPVEIALYKNNNEWIFTKNTASTIYTYEKSLSKNKIVPGVVQYKPWHYKFTKGLPSWFFNETFKLTNGQWLALIFIIFLSFLIDRAFRLYVHIIITKILQNKNITVEKDIQKNFLAPMGIMVFSIFLNGGLRILSLPDNILSLSLKGCYVIFTMASVFTAHKLVDLISRFFEKRALQSENKFDDILIPMLRKTAKFIVITVGIIFIGDGLAIDMKGLIAGMGIGGLAFAFAAKDALGNLFGSLTVLLDRPFRIGDWVLIDGKVEGTVEEVGLRSTRIRTFYDSLISLPNGQLTNVHIDNYGQRRYRRFSTHLSIAYHTEPERIEAFCEGMRQIILKHPFTRKDSFHVYLNKMGPSSLDILLYMFWKVPDWSQELHEKHRLILDILKLAKYLKVEFAFPTQTLHLYNEDKTENCEFLDKSLLTKIGEENADKVISENFISEKHRSGQQ